MRSTSLGVRGLASLFSLASAVVACDTAPPESSEMAESQGPLPDDSALLALETESFVADDVAALDTTTTTAVPDFCSGNGPTKAFHAGEKLGRHWVHWLWHRFHCCDGVERFAEKLMVLIEKINEHSASETGARRCRHAGMADGASREVDRIMTTCGDTCFAKGEAVGAVQAEAYCDLAIATSGQGDPPAWTRQSVALCGFAYEMGCDSKFVAVTTTYTNGQGTCATYTRSPFDQLWNQSRLKACDYSQRHAPRP